MGTSYRFRVAFGGTSMPAGAFSCPVAMKPVTFTLGALSYLMAADKFNVPITMKSVTLAASATPTGTFTTTTLTPSVSGTLPFSFGQAFSQGDLPSSSALTGLQVNVLSAWPDGSARFGIVSGTFIGSSGVASGISLVNGTGATGTALATTDLQAQLTQPVTIDAGAFGSATWSGADWATPFRTWASGPVMSSWVYRKPVGTDATLVGWLEVRLWSTGAVEVLPWVENGYVLTAGHVNKNATWTFTMGGTVRETLAFDLPARTRAVLVSGTKMAHWLGADPGVTVRHDAAYLMKSRLVPQYGEVSPDSVVAGWSDSITTPQEQGRFPATFGSGGYHASIGLLPQWDAMYLTNGSAKVWRVVQQQGYRAGRWGIYFRDELDSHRPVRPSLHPSRVFNVSNIGDSGVSYTDEYPSGQTGTLPPVYKTSHHSSMGYMAALITGRFFHIETTQFVVALNMLHHQYRISPGGVYNNILLLLSYIQPRGWAWSWRSLGQCLAVTPTSDAWKTEAQGILDRTVAYTHQLEVASPRNTLGLFDMRSPNGDDITPGVDPAVGAVWQHDFMVQAIGYARCLIADSAADAAKLIAIFNRLALAIVGRFGRTASTEWLFRNAAPARMAMYPNDVVDYAGGTGPWYANWGAAWTATMGPGAQFNADGSLEVPAAPPYTNANKLIEIGTLRGGFIGSGDTSTYWHNLRPALAYCVTHGASGAGTAWTRLINAPNHYTDISAPTISSPEWGVVPHAPAWRAPLTNRKWARIGNLASSIDPAANAAVNPNHPGRAPWHLTATGITNGTQGAVWDAWGGGAWDEANLRMFVFGGGHGDSAENTVYELSMGTIPGWSYGRAPTGSVGNTGVLDDGLEDTNKYFDGAARSTHTYDLMQARNGEMLIVQPGATFKSAGGNIRGGLMRYTGSAWIDVAQNPTVGWAPIASSAGYSSCYDSLRDRVYAFQANSSTLRYWDFTTGAAGSDAGVTTNFGTGVRSIYIPELDVIAQLYPGYTGGLGVYDYNRTAGSTLHTPGTTNNPLPDKPAWVARGYSLGTFDPGWPNGTWVPRLGGGVGAIVCWHGGANLDVLTPPAVGNVATTPWVWSVLSAVSATDAPPSLMSAAGLNKGVYGRLAYSARLRGLVLSVNESTAPYFFALDS